MLSPIRVNALAGWSEPLRHYGRTRDEAQSQLRQLTTTRRSAPNRRLRPNAVRPRPNGSGRTGHPLPGHCTRLPRGAQHLVDEALVAASWPQRCRSSSGDHGTRAKPTTWRDRSGWPEKCPPAPPAGGGVLWRADGQALRGICRSARHLWRGQPPGRFPARMASRSARTG